MLKDILPELNDKPYIEDLQKDYKISFCPTKDIEKLVTFIDQHWKKDHAFVRSRELLDWQHYNKKLDQYNFVIATHIESQEIHSILGFLPTSQYDENIKELKIWPCIWKVREDVKVKGLGVSLYWFLKTQLPIETISMQGLSEIALSIYQRWNFTSGKNQHHYMLNSSKKSFKLIQNISLEKNQDEIQQANKKQSFRDLSRNDFSKLSTNLTDLISKYKSQDYFINRFFDHPIYEYIVKGIFTNNELSNILFMRKVNAKDAFALRIIDVIGPVSGLIGNRSNFENLMIKHDAEYIDFINVGISNDDLELAGFLNKKNTETVVPNYFEPFVNKNIELDYAEKTVSEYNETIIVFKGDADQDRPNKI
jgi:hypothetical protein